MEKAGLVSRFFAQLIDGIVMSVIATVIIFAYGMIAGAAGASGSSATEGVAGAIGTVTYLVLVLLEFLYFGFFWSASGQSPGKKLLGIKVVRQDGSLPSFLSAGLRGTLGYWISALVLGLGFIWAIFDPDNETWHDKIFKTRVVRA
jgi:uncharacterized RDD family membrane protein YckC